jgi:2-C-methyl-D-erythritol 2,4-cyclodiphosphate synthase
MRVGIGVDLHRLVAGRPLVLGGVTVPFDRGLDGHSDADALSHAVIDGLLGAAGAGDVGRLFGVAEPARAGASSLGLLAEARAAVAERGFRVVNVDATICAEAPRLAAHLAGMQANLAAALGVDPAAVNVKATTAKGLGLLGRGEAIQVLAVVSVARAQAP